MRRDTGSIHLEPTVVLMDQLLDEVSRGRYRVPEFQRPFEWRPEQMLDLFDSIERGYPIGSLLLWQTDEPIPTLSHIGDIPIAEEPGTRTVSYVLDGHQRLSTLFGTLRRPRDAPRAGEQRDWRWWIYRNLRADGMDDRYRHHRGIDPPPPHYLPMRAVSRTMDFLHYSRELELSRIPRDELERLIRNAENVAQKIKNYQIALIRLVGGDLDQAVEVYTRLNRKGLRMEADQMVSALTYRDKAAPTLASQIDDITAKIAETGFGVVPRTAIFRAVLAIAGEQDVMSPRWEIVANRLTRELQDAIPATETALLKAVEFLRRDIRVPLAKLLPYAHQLMLLGYLFHHCPHPTAGQREALRRWFWITSWTAAFAGANSTTLRQALREMHDFARHIAPLPMPPDDPRPMPDEFNTNSARTRAYIIWELLEFPDRLDPGGTLIEPASLLASGDSQVYRQVFPNNRSPANRVILPTQGTQSVRKALAEAWASPAGERILASHGIPTAAGDRLYEGNAAAFIETREAFLKHRLQMFVNRLGAATGGDLVGEAEDDTE